MIFLKELSAFWPDKQWEEDSRVSSLQSSHSQSSHSQSSHSQSSHSQSSHSQSGNLQAISQQSLHDERGSATSEFVLLALPLFVPALLFFLSMSQVSKAEMEASMLAREAVKAFVTSENDIEGHLRTRYLLNQYVDMSSNRNSSGTNTALGGGDLIEYSIRCSTYPCIVPGSEVEITLYSPINLESEIGGIERATGNFWSAKSQKFERERVAIARATGNVDKWS